MNKILDKLSIIIVSAIIVISIITISGNSTKALQAKYYLKVDSNNREYIEKIVTENYKLTGTLNEVVYMQGLGDWYLFLYYEDGTEDETTFRDGNSKVEHLREYIRENGYNEGESSWTKIRISFWTIVVAIAYEIFYLRVRMRKKKREKEINNI